MDSMHAHPDYCAYVCLELKYDVDEYYFNNKYCDVTKFCTSCTSIEMTEVVNTTWYGVHTWVANKTSHKETSKSNCKQAVVHIVVINMTCWVIRIWPLMSQCITGSQSLIKNWSWFFESDVTTNIAIAFCVYIKETGTNLHCLTLYSNVICCIVTSINVVYIVLKCIVC